MADDHGGCPASPDTILRRSQRTGRIEVEQGIRDAHPNRSREEIIQEITPIAQRLKL
jgi:hypothetical protein